MKYKYITKILKNTSTNNLQTIQQKQSKTIQKTQKPVFKNNFKNEKQFKSLIKKLKSKTINSLKSNEKR